ncbi:hypothetical protein VOLCADRAFT_85785 [Volvox carteri f. nagariensis]|uniref:Glutathione S-transferase n=1 Tax=Volvox carteri f. nagariensis TaxID=3068 RepID=D8TGZ3_VOLCA|nr:uncharacterized protein VOLCADRAFT_85785 [Volvox carteri f. nagariensis]EFJ52620.1 hypothetical protein VOLCADRAFT_85785 [Volvox carteri f. nagariensis]|eukprot:XP_002945625.1 hypothetical protein VOLCADRAFT_85785 [Volvox carteri f. nagariensis]
MAALKLHYFDLPGRAEITRICLALGKVPHEARMNLLRLPAYVPCLLADCGALSDLQRGQVTSQTHMTVFFFAINRTQEVIYEYWTEWPREKAKMPFGQVPVLELEDGKMLAQSRAIECYVAKLAGLYPDDPLKAALADQAVFLSDIWESFAPTVRLPLESKIKAQEVVVNTKIREKLQHLTKLLLEKPGEYVAGDTLSYGDAAIYGNLCNLVSGFLPGVPKDLLDEYPVLKAFRNKIASIPAIKEHYEKHGEGYRAAFKPDVA